MEFSREWERSSLDAYMSNRVSVSCILYLVSCILYLYKLIFKPQSPISWISAIIRLPPSIIPTSALPPVLPPVLPSGHPYNRLIDKPTCSIPRHDHLPPPDRGRDTQLPCSCSCSHVPMFPSTMSSRQLHLSSAQRRHNHKSHDNALSVQMNAPTHLCTTWKVKWKGESTP